MAIRFAARQIRRRKASSSKLMPCANTNGDDSRKRIMSSSRLVSRCRISGTGRSKELVPILNERAMPEVLRAAAKRIPCPFDQRRVTTELPRDKPMHHQLRGVVHAFLVDLLIHRFRAQLGPQRENKLPVVKIQLPNMFPLCSRYQLHKSEATRSSNSSAPDPPHGSTSKGCQVGFQKRP
jgi:hypothetical protein